MKIKDLPDLERPYEKLENYGAERLSDAELLAIIIKSGTKELTSVQIAQELMKLDYDKEGLSFLRNISLQEIQMQKGIGRVKAIQIKAVGELASRMMTRIPKSNTQVKTPEDIKNMFMYEMQDLKQEVIKTVLLNSHNEIIRVVTNAVGKLNSSSIEMREVFKDAIKSSANSIILIHNHPTGDPTPSNTDIKFTKRVVEAGCILGIDLMDHIIIGNGIFCSMKRMNKI